MDSEGSASIVSAILIVSVLNIELRFGEKNNFCRFGREHSSYGEHWFFWTVHDACVLVSVLSVEELLSLFLSLCIRVF